VTNAENEILITKEGLDKLREELDYLAKIKRKEVTERIKEALSYGDLSENSEYQDAKNEQAFVEGKILELEQKVKNAKVFSEHKGKGRTSSGNLSQIGSVVTIKQAGSKEEEQYSIVGSAEADPLNGKISNESPLGNALLNHLSGDNITVNTPTGKTNYKIISVH